jgi:hypothetical protein
MSGRWFSIVTGSLFLMGCWQPVGGAYAQTPTQFEAVAGQPFGVLRVTTQMPSAEARFEVFEKDSRTLYPAYQEAAQPVRRLLRNLLDIDGQRMVSHYFLFRGSDPLTIRLHAPREQPITVRVGHGAAAHNRLLAEWWQAYRAPTRFWNKADDYPPEVENYLTTMLARRLGLPIENRPLELFGGNELDSVLGPLLGTEAARVNLQREMMLSGVDTGEASLPLPSFAPPPLKLPDSTADVRIEPIALHVPAECFYVRFGSFDNYRWLGTMLDHAGGELRNLLSVRGVDFNMKEQMERQIALRETEVSKLLGPLVIGDVALVGSDTFFREGAAFGILFEARGEGLSRDILRQRATALAANSDAEERHVEIAGRQVSFLSTPDNRLRSFYAVDGDYHFVTTSRTLARRFFEAGAGERALGTTAEFKYARGLMPIRRRDTAFVYVSEAFLRELAGPRYRVEMNRRLQAVAEIELLPLARLAAAAEDRPADTVEELVAGGFLPTGFGRRPDGSHTLLAGEAAYDSLRGPRGSFLPVPDVDVKGVTASELKDYELFAGPASQQWRRVNPIVAGIKRRRMDGGKREQVTIDAHATPLAVENYDYLASYFGPPDRQRLAPMPSDLAAFEAALIGQHVFGGLRDLSSSGGGGPRPEAGRTIVPRSMLEGPWLTFLMTPPREYATGYLGAAPTLGILEPLDAPTYGPTDPAGFAQSVGLLGPTYRRRVGDITAFSFHPGLLGEATDQMRPSEAERPAQLRLTVRDLTGSDLGHFVNLLGYASARRTSKGNARLLDSLTRQLHVPREECLDVTQRMLGARLVCPLGGEFALRETPGQAGRWVSTAWAGEDGSKPVMLPDGFRAPPFSWLRALDAEVILEPNVLSLHASLEMQFDDTTTPKAEIIPPPPPDDADSTGELPDPDKPDAADESR